MSFNDPQAVARYAEGPVRQVPGFEALQRMTHLLLAESVPADGHVLVLGAGGGLELKVFADAQPGWRFLGVDPSREMLELARTWLGPLMGRVELHAGFLDSAPQRQLDGATSLLVMHFLSLDERRATLRELAKRLKPRAPLILAHHSIPQAEPARSRWLARYAAYSAASGVEPANAANAARAISERLPLLDPAQEVALLQEAGFEDVELFYAGFTFKGWIGRRSA